MKSIICTYPLEMIHLDFLTIGKEGSNKNINILAITDHFMQYSQAFIMPKQTAPCVAKMLWENFLGPLGIPVVHGQVLLFLYGRRMVASDSALI